MVAPPVVVATAPAPDSPATAATAPDLTAAAYVRLAFGALLEAVAFLQQQMRAAATAQPDGTKALLGSEDDGLILDTIETIREALLTAGALGMAAASTGQKLARPFYGTRLFNPLRGLVDQLARQTHDVRAQLLAISKVEAERSRRLARAVFENSVSDVTAYFGQSKAVDDLLQRKVSDVLPSLAALPALDALIQELVGRYIDFLGQHPDQVEALVQEIANDYIAYLSDHPDLVDMLIQERGDRYLDYLREENPEAVQELIQGQSLGLAEEVMDQVRERTVTADSLLETMVRGILRRAPRESLPEPPEAIKQLAAPIKLPYRQPTNGGQ